MSLYPADPTPVVIRCGHFITSTYNDQGRTDRYHLFEETIQAADADTPKLVRAIKVTCSSCHKEFEVQVVQRALVALERSDYDDTVVSFLRERIRKHAYSWRWFTLPLALAFIFWVFVSGWFNLQLGAIPILATQIAWGVAMGIGLSFACALIVSPIAFLCRSKGRWLPDGVVVLVGETPGLSEHEKSRSVIFHVPSITGFGMYPHVTAPPGGGEHEPHRFHDLAMQYDWVTNGMLDATYREDGSIVGGYAVPDMFVGFTTSPWMPFPDRERWSGLWKTARGVGPD